MLGRIASMREYCTREGLGVGSRGGSELLLGCDGKEALLVAPSSAGSNAVPIPIYLLSTRVHRKGRL